MYNRKYAQIEHGYLFQIILASSSAYTGKVFELVVAGIFFFIASTTPTFFLTF